MMSHIKPFLCMYTNESECRPATDRRTQEKSRKLVVIYAFLNSLSTVQLEWNVAEKEVRLGGMTGRVGWALFSAVMTGVTSCSHLHGVSGVNKLAQWRNTHQRERKTKEIFCFFTLILPICRNIRNPAGRREEKREGRKNRRTCVEYQTLKGNIMIEVGRYIVHRMLLSLYTDVCSTSSHTRHSFCAPKIHA